MITYFIPIYNEEENLENFFSKLLPFINNTKITDRFIFVDDGSSDKSKDLIDKFINNLKKENQKKFSLITNNVNRGVGYSFKRALNKSETKYIFFLPSDNDIEFRDLIKMNKNNKFDLRMMYPINFEKYSKYRYLLSMLFRLIYCFTFDVRVNYIQSPCLYKVKLLKKIKIRSDRFSIWPEINIKLLRSNITYCEIPILYQNKSVIDRTVSIKNFIEILINYLILIYEILIKNKNHYNQKATKKYI